jgi:hypothetical protein
LRAHKGKFLASEIKFINQELKSGGGRHTSRPGRPPLAADRLRPRMSARSHPEIIIAGDAQTLAQTTANAEFEG